MDPTKKKKRGGCRKNSTPKGDKPLKQEALVHKSHKFAGTVKEGN